MKMSPAQRKLFRSECISRLNEHFHCSLAPDKRYDTCLSTRNGSLRVLLRISMLGESARFLFDISPDHIRFLKARKAEKRYLALGFCSAECLCLIPFSDLHDWISRLNLRPLIGSRYIEVHPENGNLVIHGREGTPIYLSKYLMKKNKPKARG